MGAHPAKYNFVWEKKAPKIIVEARALYGTLEGKGGADNPIILGWAKETGLEKVYKHDAIAWCGLYAAVVVKRANWEPVKDPLWARNWVNFGERSPRPMFGDVLVWDRGGGFGHVNFYVGEDSECFHGIGGNQTDMVNFTRIPRGRLIEARRPKWRWAQPAEVEVVRMLANGPRFDNAG